MMYRPVEKEVVVVQPEYVWNRWNGLYADDWPWWGWGSGGSVTRGYRRHGGHGPGGHGPGGHGPGGHGPGGHGPGGHGGPGHH